MKRTVRSMLGAVGYEIRKKPAATLGGFLASRAVEVVFDVGANVGQSGIRLRKAGYTGLIVSFEPIRAAFEELAERAKHDPAWRVENVALGNEAGEKRLNVSEFTQLSSLLPQRSAASRVTSGATIEHEEVVRVDTLDNVIGNLIGRRCFLKIDTQGTERSVLEGGSRSVPLMTGIQLELPVIHLYESVWSMSEAFSYMDGLGFVPSQLSPVVYHPDDPQALIEVDCIFRRRNDAID